MTRRILLVLVAFTAIVLVGAVGWLTLNATSHDRKLVLPGHGSGVFLPGVAGLPTTVDTESGHDSTGLQYETVFNSAGITRNSLAFVAVR